MIAAATTALPGDERYVRLAASIRMRSDPRRVVEVLGGSTAWPGGLVDLPGRSGLRRFAVDMRLRIGAESPAFTTFSKAAWLDLGWPHRTPDGWVTDLSWQASTAAPLFPVFSGKLLVRSHELAIDGLYAPPGGVIGRIADRALLHVAANATARWLLAELDAAALAAA